MRRLWAYRALLIIAGLSAAWGLLTGDTIRVVASLVGVACAIYAIRTVDENDGRDRAVVTCPVPTATLRKERDSTVSSNVMHIAATAESGLYEMFGGKLHGLCGAELTNGGGAAYDAPMCPKCMRKAGWKTDKRK
ncbi:hypothetical protein ACWDKQ_34555 [Saccharopolyspora sp. NPDC000995]